MGNAYGVMSVGLSVLRKLISVKNQAHSWD